MDVDSQRRAAELGGSAGGVRTGQRKGTLIDASLVEAQGRRPRLLVANPLDAEASWAKKGGAKDLASHRPNKHPPLTPSIPR